MGFRKGNGGGKPMGPRKSINIGDVLKSTEKGSDVVKQVEKDGEQLDTFHLQIYVPDDVDQAGIGEPSIVLKKGDYVNLRLHSTKEIGEMPDWKQKVAQLKAWINLKQDK
jgi:hypothetical protein